MSPSPAGALDPESRPSALGNFFSKFGAKRNRSKSPTANVSLKQKSATLPARSSPLVSPSEGEKKAVILDESQMSSDGRLSPPPKPKRNSSPFARVIHRLSMSKKMNKSDSRDYSQDRIRDFSQSRETVYSAACSSNAAVKATVMTPPRPAISENDLRHVTLQRGNALSPTITPLSGANTFCSEDNLLRSTRTPSYLRVSCALNGYGGYRQRAAGLTPLRTSQSVLPMGTVERRALVFSQTNNISKATPQKTCEGTMGAVMNTPTPVRQIVAQFDKLQIASDKKNTEKENLFAKAADSSKQGLRVHGEKSSLLGTDGMQLIEECNVLHHPITPKASIPISGQVLDKVLAQSVPKPVLAQTFHTGLQESTVSQSKPDKDNHAEVSVTNCTAEEAKMAINVNSNAEPKTGNDFKKLLDLTSSRLKCQIAEAARTLEEKEGFIPEYAADALRLAVGKASLLLSKKFGKFAELINKNLNPIAEDPQPTTISDLMGYWELVKIELTDIDHLFAEVEELRASNWQHASTSTCESRASSARFSTSPKHSDGSAKALKTRQHAAFPPVDDAKKAAEAKRRREAILEAKRRQKERMKEKGIEGNGSDTAVF